ncbi:MAG TPA: hypothetical protein VHM91_08375 [Verrucomicrobiales bacterium]|nr:hypothetical protein [Verrucomicrobiales bacterium]
MLRSAILLIPALLLPACTGIPAGWSEAKRTGASDPVAGAWIGEWRSEGSGHHGGLRCVVTRQSAGTCHFRYRASWAKILCAGFSLTSSVKPDGKGGYTVTGSKDLGKIFGGVFTCTGTIRDGMFRSRYEAKLDHGTMEMRKVAGQPPR